MIKPMQRLRARFPNRRHVVPSMLNILSFKEIIDLRKEIPKEFIKGSIEYHQSLVNVSKYLVDNYSAKIDIRSIQKIKDDIRQNESAIKIIKNRVKLKDRVLGCTDAAKKDDAIIIVKVDKKIYRMRLKSSDICKIESVLKCDFCVPSMRKTNYLSSFESQVKKGYMTRFILKDYIVALVLAASKIVGARPEAIVSAKIVEMPDSIIATVSTAAGSSFRAVFKLVKDVFKMRITVVMKSSTIEMLVKCE